MSFIWQLLFVLTLCISWSYSTPVQERDDERLEILTQLLADRIQIGKNKTNYCSCPEKCGTVQRGSRVLGGREAGRLEFPYACFLIAGTKAYCGCSLISDRYVLTAAHCIKHHKVTTNSLRIHLGKHHKRIYDRATAQVLKARRLIPHPGFSFSTFKNDIGIIELETPAKINKHVKYACLPKTDDIYIGEKAMVVGWGRIKESGGSSDVLRVANVPVMTNTDCKKSNYSASDIYPNMFCAGYDMGRIDACQGDSGGGLFRVKDLDGSGKRTYQIGITSWGIGCGRPYHPGVYTRLFRYIDSFIRKEIPSNCIC